MARFKGIVVGSCNPASRLAGSGGLFTYADGWTAGVKVLARGDSDKAGSEDRFTISLTAGSDPADPNPLTLCELSATEIRALLGMKRRPNASRKIRAALGLKG